MSRGAFYSVLSYLSYRFTSKSKYGIHSPFVYDLITNVLQKKQPVPAFNEIRKIYQEQARNSRVVETTDFGAYAKNRSYVTRFMKVKQIARGSSVDRRTGELLYRLVKHYNPGNILEMGTALGISTLYLAKAAPEARIVTMEGCAAKVDLARSAFKRLEVSNVEVSTGRFDTQLSLVLEKMPRIDFAFIDGHHLERPTLEYFRQIMKNIHEDSVVVLDDIHWSAEMEQAWKKICQIPGVVVTVDLYRLGLIFFKKGLSKQHFVIRY